MRHPLLPHRADRLLPPRRPPPSTMRRPRLPNRADYLPSPRATPLFPTAPPPPLPRRAASRSPFPAPHRPPSAPPELLPALPLATHTPATAAAWFTAAALVRSPLPTEAVRRKIVQQRRGHPALRPGSVQRSVRRRPGSCPAAVVLDHAPLLPFFFRLETGSATWEDLPWATLHHRRPPLRLLPSPPPSPIRAKISVMLWSVVSMN